MVSLLLCNSHAITAHGILFAYAIVMPLSFGTGHAYATLMPPLLGTLLANAILMPRYLAPFLQEGKIK